jgi:hypothetical protein
MNELFNWGGENPEQRQARLQWEQELLIEQARMKAMTMMGGVGGGSAAGYSIPIESSRVIGSTVVVGWTDDTVYINSNGEIVLITTNPEGQPAGVYDIIEEAVIEVATSNQSGLANFTSFNDQWIIEDFRSGSPVTRYAPIIAYGGTSDSGEYSILALLSNTGYTRVNPITTVLSSLYNDTVLTLDEEGNKAIEYLAEWIGVEGEIDEELKQQILKAEVGPQLWEGYIEPVKNTNALFNGLGITDTEIEVEVFDSAELNSRLKIKRSSIAAYEISQLYNFSDYYVYRERGGESQTSREWSSANVDTDVVGQYLGYTIESEEPVRAIIDALYTKGSTSNSFNNIKTTYGDTLIQNPGNGNGPKEPSYLLSVTQASGSGVKLVSSEPVSEDISGYQIKLIYQFLSRDGSYGSIKTAGNIAYTTPTLDGKTFDIDILTTISQSGAEKPVYLPSGKYSFEAYLATNKQQASNPIIYDADKQLWTDGVSGSVIPPTSMPPAKNSFQLTIFSDKGSQVLGLTMQPEMINGNKVYLSDTPETGNIYVYWNGEVYVIDNDTDPAEVYAYGPKSGSFEGTYTDTKTSEITASISSVIAK